MADQRAPKPSPSARGGIAPNDPRANDPSLVYRRPQGVYWDSISISFSMICYAWSTYGTVALLAGLIALPFFFGTLVMTGAIFHSPASLWATIPFQAFYTYLTNFLTLCLIAVGVRHVQGHQPRIKDFFLPFKKPKIAALATLLICLPAIFLDVVAQILRGTNSPEKFSDSFYVGELGLFLLLNFIFATPLTISGMAAICSKRSPFETAKEIYSRLRWGIVMLGLVISVAGILASLGALLCGIGLLYTYPILTNVFALHYVYFFPEDQLTSGRQQAPA